MELTGLFLFLEVGIEKRKVKEKENRYAEYTADSL